MCVCVLGGGGGCCSCKLTQTSTSPGSATKEYYISVKIDTSEIECFTSSFSTKALTTLQYCKTFTRHHWHDTTLPSQYIVVCLRTLEHNDWRLVADHS